MNDKDLTSMRCPVCGFQLGFQAWNDEGASHEICPSCGIHFGYDDDCYASGANGSREELQENWRRRWISGGMKWSSAGRPAPNDWSPLENLRTIGKG